MSARSRGITQVLLEKTVAALCRGESAAVFCAPEVASSVRSIVWAALPRSYKFTIARLSVNPTPEKG